MITSSLHIHPKTRLLIFDCDGTLAYTNKIHDDAWRQTIEHFSIPTTINYLQSQAGMTGSEILLSIYKNKISNENVLNIIKYKESIAKNMLHMLKPIDPVVTLVKKYHNKLPMALISGGESEVVYKTLEILQIDKLFNLIITANSDHPSKKSANAFTNIANHFDIDCQFCHVFEDGPICIKSAIDAGMHVSDIRPYHV